MHKPDCKKMENKFAAAKLQQQTLSFPEGVLVSDSYKTLCTCIITFEDLSSLCLTCVLLACGWEEVLAGFKYFNGRIAIMVGLITFFTSLDIIV